MIRFLTLSILILSLFSCEEEQAFTPRSIPPSEAVIDAVDLDSDYKYQVFYNLAEQKEVSRNLISDWDIHYHSNRNIQINTGLNIDVATTSQDLTSFTDTTGLALNFNYDNPDQRSNQLNSSVENYILRFGISKKLIKLKLNFSETDLTVSYALLEETNFTAIDLLPGEAFSFEKGVQKIFPDNNKWDLCFGKYLHLYEDGTPYTVTGVLINTKILEGSKLTHSTFKDISTFDLDTLAFTNKADIIGFDWKSYDIDAGLYSVDPNMTYILKHSENVLYKLHFQSFINKDGIKGNPTFEYLQLN